MANPNHYLSVHGHFYQPPRENPWLGVIEEQSSASPCHDWNERIAGECYGALSRSALRNDEGEIDELYNNFTTISFNIGPTLMKWLAEHRPAITRYMREGNDSQQASSNGHSGAMAQPYSHPILPLADSRDRHTQIVWGLREFEHRFGHSAKGMWLPECAINMETVRTLIDNGITFIILSPHQASRVRSFGEDNWQEVTGGSIDTRYPYRLFEVDGAGQTHFERYLDIIFYAPELNLKISFDHLLRDREQLRSQIEHCFDAETLFPQLVTIATDGEIYGHHEPGGEEALTVLFKQIAVDSELNTCNPSEYLADFPPRLEVKLWMGPDDQGSSWSCEHGVGRWFRDCGCSSGAAGDWHQKWRGPLRHAFAQLRHRIRLIYRQEAGPFFYDVDDALNNYIEVLLSYDNREHFLTRHCQRELSPEEQTKVWRLLEAEKNIMFAFTSCGWFFAELSGIEPVQNMRYALRAAEMAQEWSTINLEELLLQELRAAESNTAGNGADIFRKQVLPTRYSHRAIAATHILCRMHNLRQPDYACSVDLQECIQEDENCHGRARITDTRTCEESEFTFYAIGGMEPGVVFYHAGNGSYHLQPHQLPPEAIRLADIPIEPRREILEQLLSARVQRFDDDLHRLCDNHLPLLRELVADGIEPPEKLRNCVGAVFADRYNHIIAEVTGRTASQTAVAATRIVREAASLQLTIDRQAARQLLGDKIQERLAAFGKEKEPAVAGETTELLRMAKDCDLGIPQAAYLRESFWDLLGDTKSLSDESNAFPQSQLIESLLALGAALGFSRDAVTRQLTGN